MQAHQARVNRARRQLYGEVKDLDLQSVKIPPKFRNGEVKCRLAYGMSLAVPSFSCYQRREVNTLQVVECAYFDYKLKYQDRTKIDLLFNNRGSCDDILICIDKRITDTSYSNVVVYDGHHWWTPHNPLLGGTQREKLLQEGKIREKKIDLGDLWKYQSLVLVNAMMPFDPSRQIEISKIIPWTGEALTF